MHDLKYKYIGRYCIGICNLTIQLQKKITCIGDVLENINDIMHMKGKEKIQ